MQQDFYALADHLTSLLHAGEVYTATFAGEVSDFVRLNKNAIRQPGRVTQRNFSLDLIQGSRHAAGQISLSGVAADDRERAASLLARLRNTLPSLADDPHLLYATEVRSSEKNGENRLPSPDQAIDPILAAGKGTDLVGIYAAGGVHAGFANSLGQRNWYTNYSFNFDWSIYHAGDKAVKCLYAGFEWDPGVFQSKMADARKQLAVIGAPPRTIPPGRYRIYLTPSAVNEIVGTLAWGGFGLKDDRTRQSSLLRLIGGEASMHPSVTIRENTAGGIAPDFQEQGFIKSPCVTMIEKGRHHDSLVSPRSSKEYGVPTNGANAFEYPESVEMLPGTVPQAKVLETLGTGVYVSNLWYLNYSDRPACRMTGMTRFATLWVEDGKIVAPMQVMRFDETAYRMFGENLVGLTSEREMILASDTYGGRSTSSARLPGAIVKDFAFTL